MGPIQNVHKHGEQVYGGFGFLLSLLQKIFLKGKQSQPGTSFEQFQKGSLWQGCKVKSEQNSPPRQNHPPETNP